MQQEADEETNVSSTKRNPNVIGEQVQGTDISEHENTAQRGLIGQTIILARLVELGKEVLLPWGDHRRYDIAYYEPAERDHPARLVRIQCKVGWFYDDGAEIEFSTMSVLVKPGKGHVRRGYRGEIEYFAVYCPNNRKTYLIPVDDVPDGSKAKMRLKSAKNNQQQGILWAKDYEI